MNLGDLTNYQPDPVQQAQDARALRVQRFRDFHERVQQIPEDMQRSPLAALKALGTYLQLIGRTWTGQTDEDLRDERIKQRRDERLADRPELRAAKLQDKGQ